MYSVRGMNAFLRVHLQVKFTAAASIRHTDICCGGGCWHFFRWLSRLLQTPQPTM